MATEFEFTAAMDRYREQLLRWNPQINLVSRISTEQRIDDLIAQGVAGLGAIESLYPGWVEAGGVTPLSYFDLGSGGGFPGVVWHCRLVELGLHPETTLVEPREKRAWFLERIAQSPAVSPFSVYCGRWGDSDDGAETPGADNASGGRILISLKALRLSDAEVLGGLSSLAPQLMTSGSEILIARYYPEDQRLDDELRELLQLQSSGSAWRFGRHCGSALGHCVEDLDVDWGPGASLVFSQHSVGNIE